MYRALGRVIAFYLRLILDIISYKIVVIACSYSQLSLFVTPSNTNRTEMEHTQSVHTSRSLREIPVYGRKTVLIFFHVSCYNYAVLVVLYSLVIEVSNYENNNYLL